MATANNSSATQYSFMEDLTAASEEKRDHIFEKMTLADFTVSSEIPHRQPEDYHLGKRQKAIDFLVLLTAIEMGLVTLLCMQAYFNGIGGPTSTLGLGLLLLLLGSFTAHRANQMEGPYYLNSILEAVVSSRQGSARKDMEEFLGIAFILIREERKTLWIQKLNIFASAGHKRKERDDFGRILILNRNHVQWMLLQIYNARKFLLNSVNDLDDSFKADLRYHKAMDALLEVLPAFRHRLLWIPEMIGRWGSGLFAIIGLGAIFIALVL